MSSTAINTIMEQLNGVFTEMDAKVLENTQAWAKERKQAIREFWQSDRPKELRGNQWALYRELHEIAGGKTWYKVLHQTSMESVEKFVTKNCAAVATSRNAGIAKKLIKAEVTEVISNEVSRTADGFNGIFRVNTNAGIKVVRVQTIYAGGYNIQCLHLRVLVTVK